MPSSCCVPGCKGNYRSGPKVSIFQFPRNEDCKKKWLQAIKREKDFTLPANSRVCEFHFRDQDIIRKEFNRPKLIDGAVPTLMLPKCSPSSSATTVRTGESREAKLSKLEPKNLNFGSNNLIPYDEHKNEHNFSSFNEFRDKLRDLNFLKNLNGCYQIDYADKKITFAITEENPFPKVIVSVVVDRFLTVRVYNEIGELKKIGLKHFPVKIGNQDSLNEILKTVAVTKDFLSSTNEDVEIPEKSVKNSGAEDQQEYCRICMAEENLYAMDSSIRTCLKYECSLEIEDEDDLSQEICLQCREFVLKMIKFREKVDEFKNKARKVQKLLRKILKRKNTSMDSAVIETGTTTEDTPPATEEKHRKNESRKCNKKNAVIDLTDTKIRTSYDRISEAPIDLDGVKASEEIEIISNTEQQSDTLISINVESDENDGDVKKDVDTVKKDDEDVPVFFYYHKVYMCSKKCGEHFRTHEIMKNHSRRCNFRPTPFRCPNCQIFFKNEKSCNKHFTKCSFIISAPPAAKSDPERNQLSSSSLIPSSSTGTKNMATKRKSDSVVTRPSKKIKTAHQSTFNCSVVELDNQNGDNVEKDDKDLANFSTYIKCYMCSKRCGINNFMDYESMKKHSLRCNFQPTPFLCPKCQVFLRNQKLFNKHLKKCSFDIISALFVAKSDPERNRSSSSIETKDVAKKRGPDSPAVWTSEKIEIGPEDVHQNTKKSREEKLREKKRRANARYRKNKISRLAESCNIQYRK